MDRWQQRTEAILRRPLALVPVDNPGGEADVWRVEAEAEAIAYLKRHRVADKWHREHAILQRLAQPPSAPVPPVLDADEPDRVLLLGALPGRVADPEDARQPTLHEQAGRFRRRLDAIEVDDADPTPLSTAMEHRHRAWCQRARDHLEPTLVSRVREAFDPTPFTGATRRWCHRDLGPHNWVVDATDATPRLGVIDFGQARPDLWLVDVVKLWEDPWAQQPALADAFFAGYGRQPTAQEHDQLVQLRMLHGLATATWGDRHGHAEFSAHGRAILRRVLAEVGV